MSYYPGFICENGHDISYTSDSCSSKYCTQCGALIIHKCPSCSTEIRGAYRNQFGLFGIYTVPSYCHECGKPYTWTKNAIEAATYMVMESDLSYDQQQKLISTFPDIVSETPRTQLALIRIKKILNSAADSYLEDGLKSLLKTVACAAAKAFFDFP